MYTLDAVRKQINTMGVDSFIQWISNRDLTEETLSNFEDFHIFINGFPSISAIYQLAE